MKLASPIRKIKMEIEILAWLFVMFMLLAYVHETHDIATVILLGILLVVALSIGGKRAGK